MTEQQSAQTNEKRTRGDASVLASLAPKAFELLPRLRRTKRNATLHALEPVRDEILAAINSGIKPGTIARAFTTADELDITVSTETIRAAILEIIGTPKKRKRTKPVVRPAQRGNEQHAERKNEQSGNPAPPTAESIFDPRAQYNRKPKTEEW